MKEENIFVDTNIILDWLGKREPFFAHAKELFLKAETREIEVQISTMSYITTEYILRKQLGQEKARQALGSIRTISKVCTSGMQEIDLSLLSKMKDFEDAFQYFTALNNGAEVIITRNIKDFSGLQLPVMTAEEYLRSK